MTLRRLVWRSDLAVGAVVGLLLLALSVAIGSDAIDRSRARQRTAGGEAVLFLRRDASDRDQLFTVGPDGVAVALTDEPLGVWDYAVGPTGGVIALSTLRDGGGSRIVTLTPDGQRRVLLECPDAQCEGMAWAPDGLTMVFERRSTATDAGPAGPPKLWWLDLSSGETVALFADTQRLGFGARFSPDGRLLAYLNPDDGGVRIYALDSGAETVLDSQMGEPVGWRHDSRAVALTNVVERGEQFFVHTLRVDLDAQGAPLAPVDISARDDVDDSQPAWSPDGRQIALARRVRSGAVASPGRGIWLLSPDGSDARPLASEPTVHFAAPAWSADGRTILCQRVDASIPGARPAIWRIEVATGAAREVSPNGFRPGWWTP